MRQILRNLHNAKLLAATAPFLIFPPITATLTKRVFMAWFWGGATGRLIKMRMWNKVKIELRVN
jgi:hypothetical protein